MIYLFQNKPTPLGVWDHLTTDFETTDFLWILIIIGLVYGIYGLAILRLRKDSSDWKDVVFFSICTLGIIFGFLTFGKFEIDKGGTVAYLLIIPSFLISLSSVLIFAKSLKNSTRIITGFMVGLIAFGMLYTLVIKELSYSYGVTFGFLLGLTLGRTIHAIKLLKPLNEDGSTSKEKGKKHKFRAPDNKEL